jgi:hypothetical protein
MIDPTTWEQWTIPGEPGRLPLDPGGAKGVLHTTEGDYPTGQKALMQARDLGAFDRLHNGIINVWMRPSGAPAHFLICPPTRRVSQFFPLDRAAVTLRDLAGGIRTNRAGARVVQIELVGHADSLGVEYTDADWRWFADVLREISRQAGIPYVFHPQWISYPAGGRSVRMTGADYTAFTGWLGHQHVPENDHGDPGLIRLDLLTATPTDPTPEDPMPPIVIYDNTTPDGPERAQWLINDSGRKVHLNGWQHQVLLDAGARPRGYPPEYIAQIPTEAS